MVVHPSPPQKERGDQPQSVYTSIQIFEKEPPDSTAQSLTKLPSIMSHNNQYGTREGSINFRDASKTTKAGPNVGREEWQDATRRRQLMLAFGQ